MVKNEEDIMPIKARLHQSGDFHSDFSPVEVRDGVMYWRVNGVPIMKLYKSTAWIKNQNFIR